MFPRTTHVPTLRSLARASALALGTAALLAPTAGATSSKPVTWTLSFVDSVPKSPDDIKPDEASFERSGGLGLTGSERPYARLVRAGSIIDLENTSNDHDNYGSLSRPELLAGDVLQVVDAGNGGLYAEATFDGKPSFDATTCTGSTKGTGLRTADASVTGIGEYANVKHPWRYDSDPSKSIVGLVTNAGPGVFEGTFKRPLIAGHLLWADTTLLQSASVTVMSHSERFVMACPPPPVPPVPADTLAPAGTATPPVAAKKLRDVMKKGFTYRVSSTEAATVNATLTLQTTKGKGKKLKVKTLVVGTFTGPIAAGAPTNVTVTVGKTFKSAIAKAAKKKGSKLLLTTTLTDAAGNRSTLPVATVKFPKA